MITETWLTDSIDDGGFLLKDYAIVRANRTTTSNISEHGGVLLGVLKPSMSTPVNVEDLPDSCIVAKVSCLSLKDEVHEIPRSAMKSLSRLAVTNAHFKCNKMWYTQWFSVGWFSNGCFAGGNLGKFVDEII